MWKGSNCYQQAQSWPYNTDPRVFLEVLPVPECELCHSHTMNVKHFLTDCTNLASFRIRNFDGSNPSTLKQNLGRYKVNSNTINFLKTRNVSNKRETLPHIKFFNHWLRQIFSCSVIPKNIFSLLLKLK